jgi:antitoxin VapB
MTRRPPHKPKRAKVFWTGRSQAVRLPKAYRFEGDEVAVRREGDAVVLEPVEKRAWPPGYWRSFGPVARAVVWSLAQPGPAGAQQSVTAFLAPLSRLPFDSEAAERHAELRFALRAQPIGERDLGIASVAVAQAGARHP